MFSGGLPRKWTLSHEVVVITGCHGANQRSQKAQSRSDRSEKCCIPGSNEEYRKPSRRSTHVKKEEEGPQRQVVPFRPQHFYIMDYAFCRRYVRAERFGLACVSQSRK